jgi:hypothetical protein
MLQRCTTGRSMREEEHEKKEAGKTRYASRSRKSEKEKINEKKNIQSTWAPTVTQVIVAEKIAGARKRVFFLLCNPFFLLFCFQGPNLSCGSTACQ